MQERIAILSAPGDIGWREAAARALDDFAQTKVVLSAQSVLDPGYPVLLIWTARAATHAAVARMLLKARADIIVWRPDGAAAPRWLKSSYPIGPDMPARSLAIVIRFALAESGRALPQRRRTPRRLAPALAACGAALLACVALAAQWKPATVVAAPIAELRGTQ